MCQTYVEYWNNTVDRAEGKLRTEHRLTAQVGSVSHLPQVISAAVKTRGGKTNG